MSMWALKLAFTNLYLVNIMMKENVPPLWSHPSSEEAGSTGIYFALTITSSPLAWKRPAHVMIKLKS